MDTKIAEFPLLFLPPTNIAEQLKKCKMTMNEDESC